MVRDVVFGILIVLNIIATAASAAMLYSAYTASQGVIQMAQELRDLRDNRLLPAVRRPNGDLGNLPAEQLFEGEE